MSGSLLVLLILCVDDPAVSTGEEPSSAVATEAAAEPAQSSTNPASTGPPKSSGRSEGDSRRPSDRSRSPSGGSPRDRYDRTERGSRGESGGRGTPRNSTGGRTEDGRLTLDFDQTPWAEVIRWLAEQLDLSLQMEVPPPGRLTYRDPTHRTDEEVFDLIHGLLLNRGMTMVRREKALQVLLLADKVHVDLAPIVSAGSLDRIADSEMVTAVLPLSAMPAKEAAKVIETILSPRGKVIGNTLAGQLIVCDSAKLVRQARDLVLAMDVPAESQRATLRIFPLDYSTAAETAQVLRTMLGVTNAIEKGSTGDIAAMMGMDFNDLGNKLLSREMVGSFAPGLSFGGTLAEAPPPPPPPTRIAVDEARNTIAVTGPADKLASAATLIEALDRPADGTLGPTILLRAYEVEADLADSMAKRLTTLFSPDPNFSARVAGKRILVRASETQHREIDRLFGGTDAAYENVAVYPVGSQNATSLAQQIDRLFQIVPSGNRPLIVADTVGGNLLVRGAPDQVRHIGDVVADYLMRAPKVELPMDWGLVEKDFETRSSGIRVREPGRDPTGQRDRIRAVRSAFPRSD